MSVQLSNQIAAGEVVERPASVVKELVENAIDAKSTIIQVELKEAGIQSIQVSDNGIGMDLDDLKLSILPHATSKIYSIHDLFNIHTLGFRGEALPSIASVSKMTMSSTIASADEGYKIIIEDSEIIEETPVPPRKGTVITVKSLFYNTPARLKHLSSLNTELKHSLNFIQQMALAYPHIRFTLIHNGQTVFNTFGTGDLRQTMANVYQPNLAKQLIEIAAEDEDFTITGLISPPQLTRTSKNYIHWLINGRAVQSYPLSLMLLKAYGRQLMVGRFPIAVINIQLDPQLVDVNVHPTKQTVRLSKESELATLLHSAVENALEKINPVPSVEPDYLKHSFHPNTSFNSEIKQSSPTTQSNLFEQSSQREVSDDVVEKSKNSITHEMPPQSSHITIDEEEKDYVTTEVLQSEDSTEDSNVPFQTTQTETPSTLDTSQQTNVTTTHHIPFEQLRYVGQIHGTYLIAEGEQSFYIIDQHAAQERVRYERFMAQSFDTMGQQQVLFPFVFEFSSSDMTAVESLLPKFEQLGIYLEVLGPNSFQMETYPEWMEFDSVEKTVYDLVTLLQENDKLTIAQLKEQSIIMKSCRGAIKANHYLSDIEAKAVIRDMANLKDPYHCPHGRPVFIEMTDKTLEKLFKRIQDSHQTGHQID